jgi:beta-fructofuranosidase
MVIGGHRVGGKGCITLYGSDDLENWQFLGIPFEGTEDNYECPNFFRLGSKWVLTYSPYGVIRYYTGELDLKTLKFKPEYQGTVDYSPNFYAMNCFQLEKGRRVLIAWIGAWENGFKPGRGWAGCMSLPRELSILPSGQLVQKPVGELAELRGEHSSGYGDKGISGYGKTFEIQVGIEGETWELNLGTLEDGRTLAIACSGNKIEVLGTKIPLEKPVQKFELHMFLDRTVLEILINGCYSCTKVVYLKNTGLEFTGSAKIKNLDIWHLRSIW